MTIYNWLTDKKMEFYLFAIWSLLVNFIIRTFFSAIHNFVLVENDFNESLKVVIYIITAVVFPFIIVKIRNSDFIKKAFIKISRRTIHADIFDDIVDHNKKTIALVYLKNSDIYYVGELKLRAKEDDNYYLTLINYIVCSKTDSEIIKDCTDVSSSVVINLQEVEYTELTYEDDSEVWKTLNENNLKKEE